MVAHGPLKTTTGRSERREPAFWEAIEAQIFCPLGQGLMDVPKVLQTLEGIGYDRYATIEQDRVAGAGCPPLEDLLASMKLLSQMHQA